MSTQVQDLYSRFGPIIYSQCCRILRDEAAAEDATQEVFLRALAHLDSAPPEHAMLKWLRRICINYCLNMKRDGDRRPELYGDAELPDVAVDDFERSLVSRDMTRKLMKLAPKLAPTAMLHLMEGMTQAEVAAELGISRRTVLYRLADFEIAARKLVEA